MASYFLRRLLLVLPTLVGVTFLVFMITRVVPGGPMERQISMWRHGAAGGEAGRSGGSRNTPDIIQDIPEDMRKAWEAQFDLDKPAVVAYFHWLKKVCTLNLGESYFTHQSVWQMIARRFPISLAFGLTGFVLAYLICVPLGIAKALRHGSPFDFASSAIVFIGYSIPGWAVGVLLLTFLASGRFLDVAPLGSIHSSSYNSLPRVVKAMENEEDLVDKSGLFNWSKLSYLSKQIDQTWHMALPVFCYMLAGFASLTVLVKNSLMENLGQDYVRTAFAKGLAPRRVIFVHTLRNSLIPLATGLGSALGIIMTSSYLIEVVFNIHGIGFLGFNAIVQRDYMIVLGVLVVNTVLLLMGNILSDFLYAVIDPRIRFE